MLVVHCYTLMKKRSQCCVGTGSPVRFFSDPPFHSILLICTPNLSLVFTQALYPCVPFTWYSRPLYRCVVWKRYLYTPPTRCL